MKKTEINTNKLSLIAIALEENSHFAKRTINKDFEEYEKWKNLLENCHNSFYAFYSKKSNGIYDESLKKSSFESLSKLLHYIGKVNGAFIPCDVATVDDNDKTSTLYEDMLSFCWKFTVNKGVEIQILESKIKNNNTIISKYEKANTDTAKKSILELQLENEKHKEKLTVLYNTKDKAHNEKSKNSLSDFMKKTEKALVQVVTNRLMLTEEQVQEEKRRKDEERKARRNKKSK